MSLDKETYGVYLTPHIGKYQDSHSQDTVDVAHETWNFGNALKAKGLDLVYMHGPVGLYEGLPLGVVRVKFDKRGENQVQEFIDFLGGTENAKTVILFLYQKRPMYLLYSLYTKEYITTKRAEAAPKKKAVKKKVDKQTTGK
jgi:hypothetical protein